MVDVVLDGKTLVARLRQIKEHQHLKQARFATWTGASPQAVSKWFKGGAMTEANVRAVAKGAGVDFFALRYGPDAPKGRKRANKADMAYRDRAIELADTLPAEHLVAWLQHGEALLHQYGPKRGFPPLKSVKGDKE